MKKIYSHLALWALASAVLSPAVAVEIVNFDADSIHSSVYIAQTRFYLDSQPIMSPALSVGFDGPTVYGAFNSNGSSLMAASEKAGSGLKVRWNNGQGRAGNIASALFLFKKMDFKNGLNAVPVHFEAGSDAVSVEIGHLNPGKVGPNLAVEKARFRFVLKDSSGYHISAEVEIDSKQVIDFNVLTQVYYQYDPFENSANSSGTIGSESKPSFQNVEFVGFHIEAVRGSDVHAGANVGVIQFVVDAQATR